MSDESSGQEKRAANVPPEGRSREELIAEIEARELSPEELFAAEDPETMVPRALAQGRNREEIIAELLRLDWSRSAAEKLIDRIADDLKRYHESPESRRALVWEAKKEAISGCLLLLLGVALNVFTFLAAVSGAIGYYVVALVPIGWGLVLLHRGWTRWRLYRKASLPIRQERPPTP